jgi:hypothetical protein
VFGGFMTGTQLIALGLVVAGFIIYIRRIPLRSFHSSPKEKAKTVTPTASRA